MSDSLKGDSERAMDAATEELLSLSLDHNIGSQSGRCASCGELSIGQHSCVPALKTHLSVLVMRYATLEEELRQQTVSFYGRERTLLIKIASLHDQLCEQQSQIDSLKERPVHKLSADRRSCRECSSQTDEVDWRTWMEDQSDSLSDILSFASCAEIADRDDNDIFGDDFDIPPFELEFSEVHLKKTNKSDQVGMTLCRGEEEMSVYVSELEENGIAFRSGSIHPGDEIVEINGKAVQSCEQAAQIFNSHETEFTLCLARPTPHMYDYIFSQDEEVISAHISKNNQNNDDSGISSASREEETKQASHRKSPFSDKPPPVKPRSEMTTSATMGDISGKQRSSKAHRTDSGRWNDGIMDSSGYYSSNVNSPKLPTKNAKNDSLYRSPGRQQYRSYLQLLKLRDDDSVAGEKTFLPQNNPQKSRQRLLKRRAQKLNEELYRNMTTDDDQMSEVKLGRYWSRDERKRHLSAARESRRRRSYMQKCRANMLSNQDSPKHELSEKKRMMRERKEKILDNFLSIQELLAHGGKMSPGSLHPLLSVTTV